MIRRNTIHLPSWVLDMAQDHDHPYWGFVICAFVVSVSVVW